MTRLICIFLLIASRLCAGQVNFTAFDIFIDSHGVPLAAYQLEFSGPADKVRITGIEGGEHEAFNVPPSYDPKAMQHERVIIAAFNAAPETQLPTGKTRVATIHLQFTGTEPPKFSLKLHTASDSEGNVISTTATFLQRGNYK
jgi:hypothetical protein